MNWDTGKRIIFGTLFATFAVYSVMIYTAQPNLTPAIQMTDEARHGQQLFQEYNCVACHQFYGLGGYMGPDLTNTISTRGPDYARVFLANGTVRMPNYELDDSEIDALIEYLGFVDASGTYTANSYKVSWNGSVLEADD